MSATKTGKLFILSICILAINQTFAQKSLITILDKETNKPVALANVSIKTIGSKSEQNGITSADGKLFLEITRPSIVSASCMGYGPIADTISQGESKTLYLNKDVFNLEQVVVTATRTEKALKDAPVITQIITARQIESGGFETVQAALETELPGIEFQYHGTSTDVNMQGLEGRNVLILIDGERLAGETRGNIDYARLNTTDVERIEIVKGASSALYGSGAMGAVVNIITKQSKEKIYGNATIKYRSNNQVNYPALSSEDEYYSFKSNLDRPNLNLDALLGFNTDRFSSKTTFSVQSTDGYQLADRDSLMKEYINYDTIVYEAPSVTEIAGSESYNIKQKISYNINKSLKLEALGNFYSFEKYDFYREDKKHDLYNDISFGLKASYETKRENSLVLSIHTDRYNKYDFKEVLDKKDLDYSNRIINPKLTTKFQLSDKQNLIAGAEFLDENLEADVFAEDTLTDKSQSTFILLVQDDYQFSNKITLLAGIRGEYNTAFDSHISPKISVMYKPELFTFRLNYASGYRSPSLKELYYNWDHLGMFMIMGNENLKPETNNYYSVSLELIKPRLNMSVSAYINNFKNKIEGQWESNQTIYRYQNITNSSLKGIDYLLKIKLPGNLLFKGGYSYVNDKNRQEGVRLSSVSPHTANWQLEYRFVKTNYQFTANLSGKYIGTKDFNVEDELETGEETIETYYRQHYDGYSIWRLSVSQQFYHSIRITAGIENLLDYTANMVTFNTSISPGRRYFISLDFRFKELYKQFHKH